MRGSRKFRQSTHSGKSATIRESNHGSGLCKEHLNWFQVVQINNSQCRGENQSKENYA